MSQALDYIIVQNSFAHKNTRVDFKPGRNYIVGNYGSGKSELIEMIGFAFFGTVSLRGKANTYPKLFVELQFNHYGNKFLIKRKTSDASISLFNEESNQFVEVATSTTGVNNKITSLLGYDYNIYLLSNYCQQGKLQYFSELTPAKRLQFIDKVSGIEDAKELVDWLNDKRKSLKNTLDTLRDMIHQPTLSDGIDVDEDYEKLIDDLTLDNSHINSLYVEMKKLQSNLCSVPAKPVMPSNETKVLAKLTEEEIKTIIEKLDYYDKCRQENDSLITTQDKLAICPRKLSGTGITLEEAQVGLNQVMMNSLDDADIVCPDCSNTFSTSILKDTSHVLSHHSVKDLSTFIAWLQPEHQAQYQDVTIKIKDLSDRILSLGKEVLVSGIQVCKTTSSTFMSSVRKAVSDVSAYDTILKMHEEAVTHNLKTKAEIAICQDVVEKALEEQSKTGNLKSEYIAKKVEKDLYLKQMVIYSEAAKKFSAAKDEYDVIQSLLKEVSSLTNKIKQDTIPLINYHASNYLNVMTKGVMTDIKITENYDLIVDDVQIGLRSGAQKDLSSLAFRLSLGQSIILGMLPLFIGDEIDASSPVEVAHDITDALETMSDNGYQILLITHKDTSDLDNCNIINLG